MIRICAIMALFHLTMIFPAHAATVQLPATGQTTSFAAGDDGALSKGVTWPATRFTLNAAAPDNGGSMTDNLTGLVWSQNGNSPGPAACSPGTSRNWQSALGYVTCLNTNNYLGHADWRLPNRKELFSLINWQQPNSASWLNSQGFTGVQGSYWSSSSAKDDNPGYRAAWYVSMGISGIPVYSTQKSTSLSAWPVRGGQIGSSGPFALSATVNGLGFGTVTSAPQGTNPVGISCTSGTCSTTYPASQSVTLSALPSITTSTFGGWGGDCAGTGDCLLTMDAAKSATATFNLAPVAKNITAATDHATLIDVLTVANPEDELHLLGIQHDGMFMIDKSLTLKGGWDSAYSGLSGAPTVLNGGLDVTAGDSIAETIDIIGKLSVTGGSIKVKAVRCLALTPQ